MKKNLLILLVCIVSVYCHAQSYETSANYGKKIAIFGGSFSCIPPSDVVKAYLYDVLGAKVTTYGISGAGFSLATGEDRYLPGQIDRALNSGTNYDIFILWASTNDVARKVPLDEQDKQIRLCVEKIRKGAPNAKILFYSSLPVPFKESGYLSKLSEYVADQEKVCKDLNIPFLNLYTMCGINIYNARDFFGKDDLHMNSAGYSHIKELFARFIAAN